ncbi:MAG: ATP-binding cassette domain-containing protein [Alphaproteobacteria bacterium]|nr:ATP-binding cassette domain-containing protein [Alphaproteobacteria bacterium]
MVELRGVSKRFGSTRALRGLDLDVRPGAIVGLLGPNGSGKTTLMRMLLALLLPDEGEVRVLGRSRVDEVKHRVGYLPEDRGLYKDMKVGPFLIFMGMLRGLSRGEATRRTTRWLERMELADKVREACGGLSRGQQQRIQTIAALIHEPDLLILDEPYSGLDPMLRRMLADVFLEQHRRGCTLVLSTHLMHFAEEVCDHVVMLHRGEKVVDGTLHELRAREVTGTLICEPASHGADPAPIEALPAVEELRRDGFRWRVRLRADADPSEVLAQAARAVPLVRAEVERASLEDLFVRVVREREAS